jgi:Peroxisomal membrane protein (Pex16)
MSRINHSDVNKRLNGGCSSSSSGGGGGGGGDGTAGYRYHRNHSDQTMITSRRPSPHRRRRRQGNNETESSPIFLLWQAYKEWVYQHETKLHWMDEIVSRLLWWLPVTGGGAVVACSGAGTSADSLSSEQQQQQHRRWPREVIWGFLQLHRLFVDLALEEKDQQHYHNGTTLRLFQHDEDAADDEDVDDDDDVTTMRSQHRIRVGLDIIQSLWPVALELAAATAPTINCNNNNNNNSLNSNSTRLTTLRRQAAVALVLERVRFVLKLHFLVRYWKQWYNKQQQRLRQQQQPTSSNKMPHIVMPGIMQMGGLLTTAAAASASSSSLATAPTLEQEKARLERANYVGRRTGRRVAGTPPPSASSSSSPTTSALTFGGWRRIIKSFLLVLSNLNSNNNNYPTGIMLARLVVGEFLYIFRPLFWAQAQWDGYNHEYATRQMAVVTASAAARVNNPILLVDDVTAARGGGGSNGDSLQSWQWKAWLISLGMDVMSLMGLSSLATAPPTIAVSRSSNNPATAQEWKRRRLRLLLYLLRSPVWEAYTERRITDRVSRHLPLVGNLLATYLQDWLYYWKVYRAEEG